MLKLKKVLERLEKTALGRIRKGDGILVR